MHPKRSIAYISILIFGIIMMLFAAFTDLTSAIAISNFASLFYYAIANYAALKIDKPRYSKLIPIIGLLTCVLLLFFLTPAAWFIGGLTLVIGIVYYLAIKKRIKPSFS